MLNQLEQLEYEEIQEAVDSGTERFKIEGLDQASWAFRKLNTLQKKQMEIEELAKLETERIKLWQEEETKKNNQSKAFFEGLLIEYYMTNKEQDPKFKVSTPYGKVTARKQQPKWNYDDGILLSHLKQNGMIELIRIKEEVDKVSCKKAFQIHGNKAIDPNGQVVDGISIEQQPEKIVISVEV